MKLRTLPTSLAAWKGKRVLVRVDWNVNLDGALDEESLLRMTRSFPLLARLQRAETVVVLLTHIGRPTKKREHAFSAQHLLPLLKKRGWLATWHDADLGSKEDREQLGQSLEKAKPGSIHLLENVRFFEGEESNTPAFAKALASLGDVFVNDAFAVCHRAHASVVGIPKYLESYAGPALEEEVRKLSIYREPAKKTAKAIAFFGGKKLSTKQGAIKALMPKMAKVYLGGAMALACELARKRSVGKSFVEDGQQAFAKTLLAAKNVVLPKDYVVADGLTTEAKTRLSDGTDVQPHEYVVDVGPRTLMEWATAIREANRCVWNGPMGITEVDGFAAGSRGLARFLGYLPGKRETLVGGGDSIPVLVSAGVMNHVSFVSTGGGAMLDFLDKGERLPGLKPLTIHS